MVLTEGNITSPAGHMARLQRVEKACSGGGRAVVDANTTWRTAAGYYYYSYFVLRIVTSRMAPV